jgi:hypothetical protein
VAKTMLLHTVLDKLAQKLAPTKHTKAEINAPAPQGTKQTPFSETFREVRIPASEATLQAAAQEKGMKRIELEIAAAAGLLRPISVETQQESKQPSTKGLVELIRTVEELKNPGKSHQLDLFE